MCIYNLSYRYNHTKSYFTHVLQLLTDDEWHQSSSAPPKPPRRDRQSAVARGRLRHRRPTSIERSQKNNNYAFKNIRGNGCRVGKIGSNLCGGRLASRMCVNQDHVYRADLVHETWVRRGLFDDTAVPTDSCCCCC